MKKVHILKNAFIVFSLMFFFPSCELFNYGLEEAFHRIMNVEERSYELTILDEEKNLSTITPDDEYDVLVITDVHIGIENKKKYGSRRENDWFDQILDKNPETGKAIVDSVKFAICMGDNADHGYAEEFERFNTLVKDRLEEIKTSSAPDGIKLYNIVGNHDLYNSGWNYWSATQYPGVSFYKFETPSFSWYFLDSASGSIGEKQCIAMKKAMDNDDKLKLCFTHIPLYAENSQYFIMQNTDERNRIINTFSRTKGQLFLDGHTHEELYTDLGKFQEINVPGFLEKYGYGILHINEKTKTVSYKVMYF